MSVQSSPNLRRQKPRAFTLLEMLIVISVIAVLISLLLPAIQQAREQARRHQCIHHLQQIGIALHNYQNAHRFLPPGCVNETGPVKETPLSTGLGTAGSAGVTIYRDDPSTDAEVTIEGADGSSRSLGYRMSWIAQILPQLGHPNVYRHIDFRDPRRNFLPPEQAAYFDRDSGTKSGSQAGTTDDGAQTTSDVPEEAFAVEVDEPAPVGEVPHLSVLTCPSFWGGGGVGSGNYAGCHAGQAVAIDTDNDGTLYLNSRIVTHEIPDGAATTLLAGEKIPLMNDATYLVGDYSTLRNTGAPLSLQYPRSGSMESAEVTEEVAKARGFGSYHMEVSNFLFADGSVKSISHQIRYEVYQSLGGRNDGTVVSASDF